MRSSDASQWPITKAKRAPMNIFADIQNPPTKSPQGGRRPDLAGTTLSGPLASLLPATTDLPPRRKAQIAMRSLSPRDRRRIKRRLYYDQMTEEPDEDSRPESLTQIKYMLEKLQQDAPRWPWKDTEHKELLVPDETVMLLTGTTGSFYEENIFHVPVHNGCEVRVLRAIESEGRFRKVILIGSDAVVGLVEDRIKQLSDRQARGDPLIDLAPPPVPVYPSIKALQQKNQPIPLVRGVWVNSRPLVKPRKLDQVLSMKGFTTVKEFAEFVEDLTMCKPSEDSDQAVAEHVLILASTLIREFRDEKSQKLISSSALNQALSFLLRHQFIHYARSALLIAQNVATIETFNILLGSAAKSLNLQAFRGVLSSMRSLNIRPNEGTWVAFLDCHVSPSSRVKLAAHLVQLGYITTDSIQSTLQLTIQEIFSTHLEHGKSVDSFFDMMIDTYGVKWFPHSLINQMFKSIVIRKDYAAAMRLLDICDEQGFAKTSVTLNELLLLFHNDVFSALVFMFRLLGNGNLHITSSTYERLFLLCFKHRCYNLCRVLWISACTHRKVTYRMRFAVQLSLECVDASHRTSEVTRSWELNAGKVIVGIHPNLADYSLNPFVLNNLPAEFHNKPVLYFISALKRPGLDPEIHRRIASALVHRDIKLGPLYRLSNGLHVMLEAAYVADRECGISPRPITWLLQNTIQVPLKLRYRNREGKPAPHLAV